MLKKDLQFSESGGIGCCIKLVSERLRITNLMCKGAACQSFACLTFIKVYKFIYVYCSIKKLILLQK